WLLGGGGHGVQLSLPDLHVQRWLRRVDGLVKGESTRLPFLADARSLWVLTESDLNRYEWVKVADLGQAQICRELGLLLRPTPVFGGTDPLVCATRRGNRSLVVFSSNGAALRE